jgi:transportin-3
MFSRMLGAACSMLRSLKDISERPDVADDTFLLAGRALNYAPRLLLTPQLLSALLDSALAGVLVQHREACCSILAFVMRLLDPATHRACAPEAVAHLQAALAPRAPLLVRLVLAGVAGALPTNRLAELADVLHALLRVSAVLAGWLAGWLWLVLGRWLGGHPTNCWQRGSLWKCTVAVGGVAGSALSSRAPAALLCR